MEHGLINNGTQAWEPTLTHYMSFEDSFKDADGAFACIHGVKVAGIELKHFTRDFEPSLPDHCVECQLDQLVIDREDLLDETEIDAAVSQHNATSDTSEEHRDAKPDENEPPRDVTNKNAPSQDVTDERLLHRMSNLNVAEHQVHIIPQQRPNLPYWPEDTIERQLENLTTLDGGFSREESLLLNSYCPHNYYIRREVLVDRFSPYDPPLSKPLAEECPQCCFSFLKKEMHEIRYGFIKRRNQQDRLTMDQVGPTMHRVRIQWQWIWAVLWKWQKFKEEFRFDRPPEANEMFEEELRCATEGGTIELPIKFNARLGRFPGVIMHG